MSEFAEARLVAERLTGVGGSDIADVMNEKPWGCARRLAYQKLSVPPDYVEGDRAQRLMARGQRLEEIAVEQYVERTGRTARRTMVRRRRDAPHRLVHVDRMLQGVKDGPIPDAYMAPLECKVPGEASFKKIVAEGLPAAYILQLHWAMHVTATRWGAFAILWADGWELLNFDVAQVDDLTAAIVAAADAFWARLELARMRWPSYVDQDGKTKPELDDVVPPRLEAGDPRCGRCAWRRTCWGSRLAEILGVTKSDQAVAVAPAPELAEVLEDYLDAKRILRAHEEIVDAIGGVLREKIGEREALEVAGHRVYYRMPAPSVMLDMDAIRKGMAEDARRLLFEQYGKARKQTRTLRIY